MNMRQWMDQWTLSATRLRQLQMNRWHWTLFCLGTPLDFFSWTLSRLVLCFICRCVHRAMLCLLRPFQTLHFCRIEQWLLLICIEFDPSEMRRLKQALGPDHTNAFSKVCVFISLKTQWKYCVHTIVFRSFYPSTRKRWKRLKTLSTFYCACVEGVI